MTDAKDPVCGHEGCVRCPDFPGLAPEPQPAKRDPEHVCECSGPVCSDARCYSGLSRDTRDAEIAQLRAELAARDARIGELEGDHQSRVVQTLDRVCEVLRRHGVDLFTHGSTVLLCGLIRAIEEDAAHGPLAEAGERGE